MLSIFSCSKKNPIESKDDKYGILEGVVKIDPFPYSISVTGRTTPFVTVKLLGESSTMESVGYFNRVGNTEIYQTSFSLGSYDGNENSILGSKRGVIPGNYSVKFYDGFFEYREEGSFLPDKIDLEEKIVSTIGDTPIEVKAGRTTHIGAITLRPE